MPVPPKAPTPPTQKRPLNSEGQRLNDDVSREVMFFAKRFNDLAMDDVPKLPEPLFLSHIWPILIDETGQVDVGAWIQVAGTLLRGIDVVDTSDPDPKRCNVLFRVPPLQRSVPTEPVVRGKRMPLHEVQGQGSLRARISPTGAQQFFESQFTSRVPRQLTSLEDLKALNAIFRRYNHPEVLVAGAEELVTETPPLKNTISTTGENDEL